MKKRPAKGMVVKMAFACGLFLVAQAAFARSMDRGLSRGDAEFRKSVVKSVDYVLSLKVEDKSPDFSGRVEIEFTIETPVEGLTVDFDGGTIARLSVNGLQIASPDYNGIFLTLGKGSLRSGKNTVAIDYKHPYSSTGSGLYRFKDPEDGRAYFYSNFEPFDANKMFPCFDQPDLKATYAVAVEAPADWQVVSTAPEAKVQPVGAAGKEHGARKTRVFEKTPKLSTYVLSVHAGPYHVWRSAAGDIPLRLFARESLAKYVDAEEWFRVTRQGLEFYGGYFDLRYPFRKYDQLIVPDFNAGAMENVGAVTFSERFVHRSAPTFEDREDLAETLLHEMAHMWFGDLVTMRWWNGLWLNESFASYMEALAAEQATEFKRAWQSFFAWAKPWAYREDQLATTHPIEAEVPDTGQAFANFDGITYGKGASVLKQLAYLLGQDKFREGVRLYLKNHAYGNAQGSDFFGAMAKVSGVDLGEWTRQWLDTAGLNTVRADYECSSRGLVTSFSLRQTAPADHPQLRRHRAEVAFYGPGRSGELEVKASAPVTYEGEKTEVPGLVGRTCPAMVYPNYGDYDFVKVGLDVRSLETVKKGMSKVPDPLLRAMLWNTLWEMVRDARWPVTEYAELVLSSLGGETDLKVIRFVLETFHGRRASSPSILNYLPSPDYPRFETFFWERLAQAEPGSDVQKVWFDGFVKIVAGPAGTQRLRDLLDGTLEIPGMTVDQDRRWSLLIRLNELAAPDAGVLAREEGKRDPSDAGKKSAITAQAARPAPAEKKAWFDKITDLKTQASLGELRAAMRDFFTRTQAAARSEFVGPFFKILLDLNSGKDDEFLSGYMRDMIPLLCTTQSAAAFEEFLGDAAPLRPVLLKALKNARQEEEHCARIRALIAR